VGLARDEFGPFSATADRIQLFASSARIQDLSIERPAILAYLRTISKDKQEIALVHALEVGVKELQARRERFGK